jgi:translation initiation factor 3 subunit C
VKPKQAAKASEIEKPDENPATANPAAATKRPIKPVPVEEKKEEKPKELTEKEIRVKLLEILKERGKRGTDSSKQVDKLVELYQYAKAAPLQIEILAHLASAQFDMSPGPSTSNRNAVAWWRSAHENLVKILNIVDANPGVLLKEADEGMSISDTLADDDHGFFVGTLVGFLERLDEEFTKSLLAIEAMTSEYIARLADEQLLLDFADRVQNYYEKHPQNKLKLAARVTMVRIKHLYYRTDSKFVAHEDSHRNNAMQLETWLALDRHSHFMYQHGDERLKAHTVLCQVYFQALHDRFFEAREKLLMSHLPDNVVHMDIPTQILYNRATIQLGLCAFRLGLVKKAHKCLSELCSGGRIRELIAQGIATRFQDQKTQEQEKAEKKRQYPHHMHIQLDLVEAIHLISAMLLEVPNMASSLAYEGKKKVFSKTFHRLIDNFERQVFMGPPENNREVIVFAAKHLSSGDWRRCVDLILALPVWTLLPANSVERIKAMLHSRIQEEGLRTYLLTYCDVYDSISMEQLTRLFDCSKTLVYSIVAKMIVSQQLHAAWDENSILIVHRVDPSKLQYLALQLAEKATQFVENNERILDSRTGSYGYKSDQLANKSSTGSMQGSMGERKDGRSGKGSQFTFKPGQGDRGRKNKQPQKRVGNLNAVREQYERERDPGYN